MEISSSLAQCAWQCHHGDSWFTQRQSLRITMVRSKKKRSPNNWNVPKARLIYGEAMRSGPWFFVGNAPEALRFLGKATGPLFNHCNALQRLATSLSTNFFFSGPCDNAPIARLCRDVVPSRSGGGAPATMPGPKTPSTIACC